MGDDRSRSRGGIYAAVAAVAITAGLGIAGAAGAGERADVTVFASEQGSWCFTTDATNKSCSSPNAPVDVTIDPGDTVTWEFPGPYSAAHNAISDSANWTFTTGPASNPHTPNPTSYEFNNPGVYTFRCQLHDFMNGTVRVGNATPTPTATATATPPSSPPPDTHPDTHPDTPAPSGSDDAVKPTVRSVRSTAIRRGVRVRFTLSEPATVTVRVKRARRVVKSARVQAPAGTRTVTLRSKRLKKGRYTVEIAARDGSGNRSRLATKRVTLRR
jgi:plastocyanin